MNSDLKLSHEVVGVIEGTAPQAGVFEMPTADKLFKGMNIVEIELIRNGVSIHKESVHNDIVTVGKNSLLDVAFRNQTQVATWYVGLVDNASFSAFASGDTMSSHAGWIEATIYDESTRVTWSPAAASGGSISNSSAMTFTINSSGTMKGVFITSGSAKSGTTGTLWATAAFGSTVAVSNGDQLKVTYTVNA